MGEERKHVVCALVEDKPGVLAHIAGLFSSRGYNIDSLTVGGTETEGVSRMTIVVKGDEEILEQIVKQLRKVIDVVKVQDLPARSSWPGTWSWSKFPARRRRGRSLSPLPMSSAPTSCMWARRT